MLKFTIICGLNDQYTKKQEITTEEAYKKIVEVLHAHKVDGATFTECRGLYIHDDGTPVFENSIKIELLFITAETANAICDGLKIALNQEAVVLEAVNIDSQLK